MYHVITGNYLPRSKKLFENEEDAIEHIKKIIEQKDDWVTKEQIHMSYQVLEIDEVELNSKKTKVNDIFLHSEEILPKMEDYKNERFRPKLLHTPKKPKSMYKQKG